MPNENIMSIGNFINKKDKCIKNKCPFVECCSSHDFGHQSCCQCNKRDLCSRITCKCKSTSINFTAHQELGFMWQWNWPYTTLRCSKCGTIHKHCKWTNKDNLVSYSEYLREATSNTNTFVYKK